MVEYIKDTSALSVSTITVSRSLALSFQSAFQLSFTVLVCYRSRSRIQLQVKFTTRFGLRFQTTRLRKPQFCRVAWPYWCKTIFATAFQRNLDRTTTTKQRLQTQHRKIRENASYALSLTLFTRSYSGYPCWFLFLCLLICLSSAGSHTQFRWIQPKNGSIQSLKGFLKKFIIKSLLKVIEKI